MHDLVKLGPWRALLPAAPGLLPSIGGAGMSAKKRLAAAVFGAAMLVPGGAFLTAAQAAPKQSPTTGLCGPAQLLATLFHDPGFVRVGCL